MFDIRKSCEILTRLSVKSARYWFYLSLGSVLVSEVSALIRFGTPDEWEMQNTRPWSYYVELSLLCVRSETAAADWILIMVMRQRFCDRNQI